MGRLIVGSIAARDFLSYHDEVTVELGGRGPMAVVGMNGVGKSTLVSKALAWCLYGSCSPERMGAGTKTMRGKDVIRKRLDPLHQATPKATAATVLVRLVDEDSGAEWHIKRTRGSTGSDVLDIQSDSPAGHTVEAGTQEYIDRLIGADFDVFVRTCLRGQNDPWNFAEATDAKKREILDSISGAATLDDPHKIAKDARDKAKREADVLAARIADATRRRDSIDLSAFVRQTATWAAGLVTRTAQAQAEVDAATAALAIAETHDAGAADNVKARAELEQQKPVVDFTPYDDSLGRARVAEAQQTAILNAKVAGRLHAEKLIAAGKCPECGQSIAADSMAHQAMAVAVDASDQMAAVNHRIACEEARRSAESWLKTSHSEWQAKMSVMSETRADMAPMARVAKQAAERRLADIQASENPYQVAAEEARKQHYALVREVAQLQEAHVEAARQMRLGNAWVEVLSPKGVRAHMAESALTAIEAEANKWLAVLSNGRFSVSFPPTQTTQRTQAVREEIQTVIKNGDTELPFIAFSGGEKTRINLAVDLGVASTFARGGALALSLLVLDEQVFSGLDEDGKAGVVAALHHAGVADVVVIDHDPRLSGVLPRTVRAFRGPDGYSRIEEVA